MNYIDSHSHLYLEEFSKDLPEVIERARQAGVEKILLPNIDSATIDDMLSVCSAYKGYCYPMMGLHPTSVGASYREELAVVEERLSSSADFIAVGEVGLDLYWDKTYLKEQTEAFDKQINLAMDYGLPVVIHSRDSFEQVYDILSAYRKSALKGVFHSFTGSLPEAERLMEFEGFMLGINGVVTFKNSNLSETLRSVPPERIIVETDAPYLTPVPYRGRRNESSYLEYTLATIAGIYGLSVREMAAITRRNTLEVFERLK